ncbi:MAG: YgjP-like metallopeptidase domain-containing protein, partial [Clostridia bacterium]
MIVDGNEIEVLKKRIKNLHLYVLSDGKIRVSAPIRMTLREIEEFIHSKAAWIEKHQNIIAKRQPTEPMKCVDGESVVLWGEKYTLIFKENEKINCARLNGDCVIFNLKRSFNGEEKKLLIELWQKEKLKEEIPPLIQKWQKILEV